MYGDQNLIKIALKRHQMPSNAIKRHSLVTPAGDHPVAWRC
jgi:hypothetical protein